MHSAEVIRMIEADGWFLIKTRGSHHQFKHPAKPGKVTVPHPRERIHGWLLNSILSQAGLR